MATPSNELNQVIGNSVSTVVHAYGGDIEDPLTTWPSSKPRPYAIPATMSLRDHDVAPAPLTILLIAFSAVVLLLYPGPDTRYVRTFMACGGVAFVLVAGLITPNVYNNRVLLAPVLALVPVVGVAFTALSRRPGSLAKGVFLTMLVAVTCVGLAAMSWNARNPLVPVPHRIGWSSPGYWSKPYDELRFSVAPEYLAVRTAIVRAVDANGIERIGIVQPGTRGFPVYPLLGALSGREVRYVRYTALADRISPPQFAPQAMLEIVNSEAYPWVLDDGTARGEMLVRPVRLLNWVVFLYRTP
jgi:hypothetical protein